MLGHHEAEASGRGPVLNAVLYAVSRSYMTADTVEHLHRQREKRQTAAETRRQTNRATGSRVSGFCQRHFMQITLLMDRILCGR